MKPMPEKDTIFSSKIKYNGIVDFPTFYKFCYDWLTEEVQLEISEDKYAEKIDGDAKNIEIVWSGKRKMTDYFRFDVKVNFQVLGLTKLEIVQDGKKIKTNKGSFKFEGAFKSALGIKFDELMKFFKIYRGFALNNFANYFVIKNVHNIHRLLSIFIGEHKHFISIGRKRRT